MLVQEQELKRQKRIAAGIENAEDIDESQSNDNDEPQLIDKDDEELVEEIPIEFIINIENEKDTEEEIETPISIIDQSGDVVSTETLSTESHGEGSSSSYPILIEESKDPVPVPIRRKAKRKNRLKGLSWE